MEKTELQALRRLLFFSRQEAALWVASGPDRPQGVTDRSWRMWEDGTRPIPDDVASSLLDLKNWRNQYIEAFKQSLIPGPVPLLWFDSADDFCILKGRNPIFWRPYQSAITELYAVFDATRLIPFDREAFASWMRTEHHSRSVSEDILCQWAGSKMG